MEFNKWLQENNLHDLYSSTVQAFPHTTRRQHSTDSIQIKNLNLTLFLGMQTLYVRSLVQNEENGNQYIPQILFKKVNYQTIRTQNSMEITTHDGKNIIFEKLNQENDVLVRCNCKDFSWRFNFTDHADHSLYGRVRNKYEAKFNPGSSNPLNLPGMCKHLIALAYSLNQTGIIGG